MTSDQKKIPSVEQWVIENQDNKSAPEGLRHLREQFVVKFPKESLAGMTSDKYALGRPDSKQGFCYWLEFETKELGDIRGGNVRKWGLWWAKSTGSWMWTKKYQSEQEAISRITSAMSGLILAVEQERFDELDTVGADLSPMARAKILFMYYPDLFLPVFNKNHVVKALRNFGLEPISGEAAPNRQLLAHLKQIPNFRGFDAHQMMRYLYDCHELKPAPAPSDSSPASEITTPKWLLDLNQRLVDSGRNIWKVTPGDGAKYWPQFREHGCIAIGYDPNVDYSEFADKESLRLSLERSGMNVRGGINPIWYFAHDMVIGDVVVAITALDEISGIGIVATDYFRPRDSDNPIMPEVDYQHYRRVDWLNTEQVSVPFKFGRQTVTPVKTKQWNQLLDSYGIPALNETKNGTSEPLPTAPPEIQQLLHISERTRNIILYGPPGTGKTWAASEFARYFLDPYDGDHLKFVTFHQSFAYEDFVEGLKPVTSSDSDNVTYRVQPGIFRQICSLAETEWSSRSDDQNVVNYLLVIDEINRANISKVLGELITVMEDDKRLGETNEIRVTLPYSKDRFGIPPNLYILGTMNTADRSIALLDVALRRRFTFVEILPNPVLLSKSVAGIDLASLLVRLNDRIAKLLDRDYCLGHSFFMDLSSLEDIHFIWYHKIIPLLQEYFYNDFGRLRAVIGSDFVHSISSSATDTDDGLAEYYDSDESTFRVMSLDGEVFRQAVRRLAGKSTPDEIDEGGSL